MKHTVPLAILASLFAALLTATTEAQTTTPSAETQATGDPSKTRAVQLTPFEVSSAQDVGYMAGNTTSGSRLNTSLKDTAAPVMVFTSDFFSDFGASSLAESVAYANNLQLDVADTVDNGLQFVSAKDPTTKIRVRGLLASIAMDYFESTIPTDNYNTERMDLSSGPNSILYGFASPGGLISFGTKRAQLARNRTMTRIQVGEFEFRRFELDHNQVLLPGKLAFRVNGLQENSAGWRHHDFKDIRRATAAIRLTPWKKTNVSVGYENGQSFSEVSRMYNAFDQLSLWRAQGGQRKSDLDWTTADRAIGINRSTAVQNIFVTNADGSKPFVLTTRDAPNFRLLESTFEDLNTPPARRVGQTFLPERDLPFDYATFGPGSSRDHQFDRFLATATHVFSRTFSFEVSYRVERNRVFHLTPELVYPIIYGDPNAVIPDPDGGTTVISNPNAGRFYMEGRWNPDYYNDWRDGLRGGVAWELNLGKLGTHRIGAMVDHDRFRAASYLGGEILVDANNVPINNANVPENLANQVLRRHYVTPGKFETYFPGDGRQPVTGVRNGRTYHSTWVQRNVARGDIRQMVDSGQLVTHSTFFKSRLVFTGGLRSERIKIEQAGNTRLSANDADVLAGRAIRNELKFTPHTIADTNIYKPVTATLGAVLHLTPWLSTFYNQADNNSAPTFNRRVLPDELLPPAPSAVSKDYGLMLNLLDGRVFVRATTFRTTSQNGNFVGITGAEFGIDLPNNRILEALRDNNRISESDYTAHLLGDSGSNLFGLTDLSARGHEVATWVNLTKSLTAVLNFSHTKMARTRIVSEFEGWFERESAFWLRTPGAGSVVNPVSASTVNQEVDELQRIIKDVRDYNTFNYGDRPYKANVSGRYTFLTGRLKGTFVGGGARWQGKSNIGRQITGRTAKGSAIYGETYVGPEDFKMDGFIGYRRKLAGQRYRPELTVQLNVTNLTAEDEVMPLRYNANKSGYSRVLLNEPRKFRLTMSAEF